MIPKFTYDNSHMPIETLSPILRQVDPICLDILYRRGFRTEDEINSILFPSLAQAIQPFTCQDIKPALDILEKAVREKQTIVVYRDYDVDGITAGAVAVETLTHLGAVVHHYANERSVDGFGICTRGIDAILKQWPETKLILTVDNGINGNDAIEYANNRGLTVVVTDHHIPGAELPAAADAVVDLKRKDETYPYHDLCGCGVIFRVMLDLYRQMKQDPSPVFQTLDLVALATVADVVPLIGENRALLKEGLKLIETAKRPFFRVMAKLFEVQELSAHYTLAFQYIPALNSLSRMGEDTSLALEALISKDENFVELQAQRFTIVNQKRKELTQKQFELALSLVGKCQDKAIVLYDEGFDEGIVGIIAGRLKEQFWRPAIVFAKAKDGTLKGSGRSIDEFDLKVNLDACSSLLETYGGHQKAAGVSVKAENFNKFADAFKKLAAQQLDGVELRATIPLSAVLTEDTLTEQLVRNLRVLEPYGEGFPEPVFGLKANPNSVRYMGKENQHVKYYCSSSNLSIIAWNRGNEARSKAAFPNKFIGKPGLNIWQGSISVQFIHDSNLPIF